MGGAAVLRAGGPRGWAPPSVPRSGGGSGAAVPRSGRAFGVVVALLGHEGRHALPGEELVVAAAPPQGGALDAFQVVLFQQVGALLLRQGVVRARRQGDRGPQDLVVADERFIVNMYLPTQ